MKIALKSQGSGWVIDNIVNDYKKHTRHKIVGICDAPDVIWSVDLFSFPLIVNSVANKCKKFVHVHHIDESKIEQYPWRAVNKADAIIVPNKITEFIVSKYVNVPVYRVPYWLLSDRMKPVDFFSKKCLKESIGNDCKLIGSFVKDGNGRYGETPKLSKGPDILVEVLLKLANDFDIKVVLAGYGRKWLEQRLIRSNIKYVYFERYKDINSLYDCLDYYLVTSRVEGGPQSILETSYRKIKVLSTNVGIASEVLRSDSICNCSNDFVSKIVNKFDDVDYNYNSVQNYLPNKIIPMFDKLFEEIS